MPNIREQAKRARLQKLAELKARAKKKKIELNKKMLVNMLIIEHCISKKTALEEVEAVLEYDFFFESSDPF